MRARLGVGSATCALLGVCVVLAALLVTRTISIVASSGLFAVALLLLGSRRERPMSSDSFAARRSRATKSRAVIGALPPESRRRYERCLVQTDARLETPGAA